MSQIQVFNTLSGKKEEFHPINGNRVMIYACGPTVYDLSHLGHARMTMVWDVAQRYLRYHGYDVTYVRNITDVDDKIINRARELGTSPERVAREYTFTFWNDMHRLNNQPPDFEPRATEFIERMIAFAQGLIERGHAYESEGDVYFDVGSFKEYGKLGRKDIGDLIVGAREQVRSQEELAEKKRSPVDFALWKAADQADLSWPSPWGHGRPGWHLECSTMIKHVLSETIDIHAGGEDLVFPHNENELAQSHCLHDKPLAKYWLHNSFVQISSEKMSKSLGNFSTIDDLLTSFTGDTIRLFVLQTQYRHPIDFTLDSLASTRSGMSRLLRAASFREDIEVECGAGKNTGPVSESMIIGNGKPFTRQAFQVDDEVTGNFKSDFETAMDNDFNTASAVSHLFTLCDRIFSESDEKRQAALASVLTRYGRLLGLTLTDTRRYVDSKTGEGLIDLVLSLRQKARDKKDYATSDLIRDQLSDLGISVMDKAGTDATWEKL